MSSTLAALAHPTRRRILDLLVERPGSSVADLAQHFDMSAVAVLKHVQILAAADLIHSEKVGRARSLHFNAVPIQQIYDRWTTDYSAFWATRMVDIKDRIESRIRQRSQRSA